MKDLDVCLKIFIYGTLPLFIIPFKFSKKGYFEINFPIKVLTSLLLLCVNCFAIYVYAINLRPKFEDRDPFIILGYLRVILNSMYTMISTVQITRNYKKVHYFVKKIQRINYKLPLSKQQSWKIIIVAVFEVLLFYCLTLFFLYAFYLRSLTDTATRILLELSATFVYLNTVCGEIFFLNFIAMISVYLKNLHGDFEKVLLNKECLWSCSR